MKLNEIKDNPGARKERMRVGRGIGSGKGKTCGRGVKGQKARTGVSINGFEGGQNPLYRRLPKRGFNNFNFARDVAEINLDDLQAAVDTGLIDPAKVVNLTLLKDLKLVRAKCDFLKVLGRGELKASLQLEIWKASKTAAAGLEKAKSKITFVNQD
ncbi:MAG: 50S ribosomal protein L15 [Alphaproteobacteria bacterium]|nr:50S ribosomal protein L15 [Alphaproteobacteria bacterium]